MPDTKGWKEDCRFTELEQYSRLDSGFILKWVAKLSSVSWLRHFCVDHRGGGGHDGSYDNRLCFRLLIFENLSWWRRYSTGVADWRVWASCDDGCQRPPINPHTKLNVATTIYLSGTSGRDKKLHLSPFHFFFWPSSFSFFILPLLIFIFYCQPGVANAKDMYDCRQKLQSFMW